MIRENRYVVFKVKDIMKYLSNTEGEIIMLLGDKIDAGRIQDDKLELKCAVIEHDWPEYEPVWKMVEDRVDKGN